MQTLHHTLKKKRVIIFVVGLIVGAFLGGTFHKETIIVREGTANTPAALTSVNIMIDDGHGSVRTWNTVDWHEAMSVMDLLDLLASTKNITYTANKDRTKVVSMDGISATGTSSERWQYWVNNTYEPKVPNKYYLKPGDIVLWKFVREQAK
jgi:hypothetical protein